MKKLLILVALLTSVQFVMTEPKRTNYQVIVYNLTTEMSTEAVDVEIDNKNKQIIVYVE